MTDIEAVAAYTISTTDQNALDAIETIAETTARELAEAKDAKIAELNAIRANYAETDYTEANWDILDGYIISAIAEANALTTIAAVNGYSVSAVEEDS